MVMARPRLFSACLALVLLVPGLGLADPWKDESGYGGAERRGGDHHGERRDAWQGSGRWGRGAYRERGGRGDGHHRRRWDDPSRQAQPRIPPGHLPPPGEFRLWYPDRPPGHQPPPQRW